MGLISYPVFSSSTLGVFSLYGFLIYMIVSVKAFFRLPKKYAIIVCLILLFYVVLPYSRAGLLWLTITIMYGSVLFSFALLAFYQIKSSEQMISKRYEALQGEFRVVKRQLAFNDKQAREEERAQMARDMHDSVGHQLTALSMRLEVLQMKESDVQLKEEFMNLKKMAQNSLEETRNAVKALHNDSAGGLSAIIALIRKLEAESHVRINFSIKHGALTAPLSNDQVVAVYRAVQEGLTNIMRHSNSKEATITFESLASIYFQFEMCNPIACEGKIIEGFGLTSMRKRINQVGGNLRIQNYQGSFMIQGRIPYNKELMQA